MKVAGALAALVVVSTASGVAASPAGPGPTLQGRAVLPVETYAPGPPAGAFFAPNGPTVINGIRFPVPSQPVEGFSAVVAGRHEAACCQPTSIGRQSYRVDHTFWAGPNLAANRPNGRARLPVPNAN